MQTNLSGLLGEIVTWQCPPNVSYTTLKDALRESGLGENLVRDMLPRNAFGRAVKYLKESRVIKPAAENDDYLTFQFTREYFDRSIGQYQYQYETKLVLNKHSGHVASPNAALAAEATQLIMNEIGRRVSSDITRIVQKVFEKNTQHKDLFAIRAQGGAYFVPDSYRWLVDQVQVLFDKIGGGLLRWQINDTPSNTQAVGQTICDAVEKLVADYRQAVDEYDPHNSAGEDLSKVTSRIFEIQGLMRTYQVALGDLSKQLGAQLESASEELSHKIETKAVTA